MKPTRHHFWDTWALRNPWRYDILEIFVWDWRMNCWVDPLPNKMCSRTKVWELRSTFCLLTPRIDRNFFFDQHTSSNLHIIGKVFKRLLYTNAHWIRIPIFRFDPFNFNIYEQRLWYFIDFPRSKATKVTSNQPRSHLILSLLHWNTLNESQTCFTLATRSIVNKSLKR